jgi:pimeloyl-ACP methyl ester carboxylesterase
MSKMPTTRRTLNAMLLAAASFPLLSQGQLYAQASSTPRPFRVDIPQAKIDRILARVRDAEWPDRLDAPDLRYGVSWDYSAWIVEKLKGWSDSTSPFEPAFTKDQVLTNVMIYLVTNTMDTSVWMYRGREDDPDGVGAITVPTGYASLPREIVSLAPPRHVLERNYNLVRYSKMPHGGHFAFWEATRAHGARMCANFFRN